MDNNDNENLAQDFMQAWDVVMTDIAKAVQLGMELGVDDASDAVDRMSDDTVDLILAMFDK